MKNKLKFIWKILIQKENGWIFFKLSEKNQTDIITGTDKSDVTIMGIGVDDRVLQSMGKRLEQSPIDVKQLEDCKIAMQRFCERVEKGEIRSVVTYATFKEILLRYSS